jgi:anti-sigma factor RsiW
MDCREIAPYIEPYGDGELGLPERAAVEAHLAGCLACQEGVAQHRQFRDLLRRQSREVAPPELHSRVTRNIRRRASWQALHRWGAVPLAAAMLIALASLAAIHGIGSRGSTSRSSSLVADLVSKHATYAQIEAPVEFASANGADVRGWFRQRLGVRVTVPDYTPAGIRLLGGRIAETHGRKTAYLLYEKGHTLMSVFMVTGERLEPAGTATTTYRGFEYHTADMAGQHSVFWAEGQRVFGVVSSLDFESLLECADRLRAARIEEERL